MSKRTYDKPPIGFEEQLKQLNERKLIIEDRAKALATLANISYYRLSAYFLPYQSQKDKFNQGTTFKQIVDTYSFDRELRLLVFDCIERIEVAIRTQFVQQMAVYYNDSHWQDKQIYFIDAFRDKMGNLIDPLSDFQNIISRAKTAKNPEIFIQHYLKEYDSPPNPPSWMCFELLTIGEMSRLYKGLRKTEDKKRIAQAFDVHHTVFISWLHALTYVRNICAHHSRLWNKNLAVEPLLLSKPIGDWVDVNYNNNSRVFYFLCLLKYLLMRVNPNNRLTEKLEALFNKYPHVPIKYMGIPSDGKGNSLNWTKEAIWKK